MSKPTLFLAIALLILVAGVPVGLAGYGHVSIGSAGVSLIPFYLFYRERVIWLNNYDS